MSWFHSVDSWLFLENEPFFSTIITTFSVNYQVNNRGSDAVPLQLYCFDIKEVFQG